MKNKKRVLILGSTGSIGTQALEVISAHEDKFEIAGVTAGRNASLLLRQVERFLPSFAAISNPPPGFAPPKGLRLFTGADALEEACIQDGIDVALVAVVGIAGLRAVMTLLERGIPVLLANKETLVAGGKMVMDKAKEKGVPIIPVDSEHSAIFQCLEGNRNRRVAKLVLTASGGPFRGFTRQQLQTVTLEQALRHPNWAMGQKITVDSATMMNKALEVIEAGVLFDMPAEQIEVLVHPQSIVHSAVEYEDGAVLAQMGTADMRTPIAFALSYPERLPLPFEKLSLANVGTLQFEKPDLALFPALALGFSALKAGGTMPASLNGANEAAVELFIKGKIGYLDIARLVEEAMQASCQRPLSLENAVLADEEARHFVHSRTK